MKYNKHYVGSTENVEQRLKKHNAGGSIWTKKYRPWELIYIEKYDQKVEALKREKQIKSYKGGQAFKKLIQIAEMTE